MEQRPCEVSIIIPCFNREALICQAIESALAQGPCAEVIVIDDGSTDGSWRAIERYKGKVRALHTTNRGVSVARNTGLALAGGKWIRFLDSDDCIPAGAVEAHLTAAAEAPPNQITVGDALLVDENGAAIEGPGYGYAHVVPPGLIPTTVLLENIMSPWLPLFPADALRRIGGFDAGLSIGEDHELALRLYRRGHRFTRVPVVVTKVLEHQGERLSRGLGPVGYGKLLATFQSIWRGFETDAQAEISRSERASLARLIWVVARDAARARSKAEANGLFKLAAIIGDGAPLVASPALRMLYALLAPYPAEGMLEKFKALRWKASAATARLTPRR